MTKEKLKIIEKNIEKMITEQEKYSLHSVEYKELSKKIHNEKCKIRQAQKAKKQESICYQIFKKSIKDLTPHELYLYQEFLKANKK